MTRPTSLLFLLLLLSRSFTRADPQHFEGFEPEDDEDIVEDEETLDPSTLNLSDLPLTQSQPPPDPTSNPDPELNTPPESQSESEPEPNQPTPISTSLDYWDEDEFEGLPVSLTPPDSRPDTKPTDPEPTPQNGTAPPQPHPHPKKKEAYLVEIACVSFLIVFIINFFTGKRENENIALSWATKFATKDSIFERNFSLLGVGVGDGDDSPLLLKEGQGVFKFYASGRRYCQGLLATMELKSRHDLLSRLYNMVVPCRDEITFEVFMNDDAMDHVVFALARKKLAKFMQKEFHDLQKFAGFVGQPPASGRKWVPEELSVVSESREVAGDLITDVVLEQVFGEKAFDKLGKGFISMHFTDQHVGTHKKVLFFKFALPDAKNMADMTRLVALVPYYIDLIGRYRLSSQARSKTEATRNKAAQEAYKELQSARQEAIQKKKAERRKLLEEAEAKLSAEAIRKKEAKDRARQMKKSMSKVKISRA